MAYYSKRQLDILDSLVDSDSGEEMEESARNVLDASTRPLDDTDAARGVAFMEAAKQRAAERQAVALQRGNRANWQRKSYGNKAALNKQCLCCKRWKFIEGKRVGCDTCNPFPASSFCCDCLAISRDAERGASRSVTNLTGENQDRIAEASKARRLDQYKRTGPCRCIKWWRAPPQTARSASSSSSGDKKKTNEKKTDDQRKKPKKKNSSSASSSSSAKKKGKALK